MCIRPPILSVIYTDMELTEKHMDDDLGKVNPLYKSS